MEKPPAETLNAIRSCRHLECEGLLSEIAIRCGNGNCRNVRSSLIRRWGEGDGAREWVDIEDWGIIGIQHIRSGRQCIGEWLPGMRGERADIRDGGGQQVLLMRKSM